MTKQKTAKREPGKDLYDVKREWTDWLETGMNWGSKYEARGLPLKEARTLARRLKQEYDKKMDEKYGEIRVALYGVPVPGESGGHRTLLYKVTKEKPSLPRLPRGVEYEDKE